MTTEAPHVARRLTEMRTRLSPETGHVVLSLTTSDGAVTSFLLRLDDVPVVVGQLAQDALLLRPKTGRQGN